MLYFDANATTPCAPEVQEAMRPYWSGAFANVMLQQSKPYPDLL